MPAGLIAPITTTLRADLNALIVSAQNKSDAGVQRGSTDSREDNHASGGSECSRFDKPTSFHIINDARSITAPAHESKLAETTTGHRQAEENL